MSESKNLNEHEPFDDSGRRSKFNRDNSIGSGKVRVYFRGLTDRLTAHINAADAIFGCVAWLTHPQILDALSHKSVAIVVQKEDFLRPDLGVKTNWKAELRSRYLRLKCASSRYAFENVISALSYAGDPTLHGVRCVGNYNREKSPAFPRMHNKFLIFCRHDLEATDEEPRPVPYGVWTGSFNLTFNAENSLENALYLEDQEVVSAYFNEFAQIVALSEQLDWENDWSAPEWRIGT